MKTYIISNTINHIPEPTRSKLISSKLNKKNIEELDEEVKLITTNNADHFTIFSIDGGEPMKVKLFDLDGFFYICHLETEEVPYKNNPKGYTDFSILQANHINDIKIIDIIE
ncbi:TPA: hypothetical protein ACGIK9_003268 [Acinetobacter baumannii]|uniref:hypothetical protein n=1 Tax=Acinetobacter baumannii TaxID=470 RepID=UPI00338D602C